MVPLIVWQNAAASNSCGASGASFGAGRFGSAGPGRTVRFGKRLSVLSYDRFVHRLHTVSSMHRNLSECSMRQYTTSSDRRQTEVRKILTLPFNTLCLRFRVVMDLWGRGA